MERTAQWGRMGSAFRAAFPATLPVLTGFFVLGLAYGVLMETKGYGPLWSGFVSAVVFSGGMQFAAIPLLATVFDPVQAFFLSLMVNARHVFYGLALLGKYQGMGWKRAACIYILCDENFSLASTVEPPEGVDRSCFYFAMSILNWSYWVISSILGGVLGNFLTFNTEGMDFALTALFTVLLLEQLSKRENWAAGAVGILSTVVSLLLFGADHLIIPAMALILAVLLGGRKKLWA